MAIPAQTPSSFSRVDGLLLAGAIPGERGGGPTWGELNANGVSVLFSLVPRPLAGQPGHLSREIHAIVDSRTPLRLRIAATGENFSSKAAKEAAGVMASPSVEPVTQVTILRAAMSDSGYEGPCPLIDRIKALAPPIKK